MESRKEFLLKDPIQVAVEGDLQDVQVIDLVAPAKKVLRKTHKLRQYLARAFIVAQQILPEDKAGAEDDSELDGGAIKAILLTGDADVEACLDELDKLALSGCVEVNEAPINKIQWGKVSEEDKEDILAEYLVNFILPLVMKTLTGS